MANDSDAGLSAGQEELPFDPPVSAAGSTRRSRYVDRLRQRVATAADLVVHRPGHALANVAVFLLRWALRICLPVAGAAIMLHLFPYRATAGGAHFRVEGTLLVRSGLSADTTFGNWEFKRVDGLPIGAHVSPENVDVVRIAAAATRNGQAYVDGLRQDLADQIPSIIVWLAGEALLGFLLGLAAAAVVNLAARYVRRLPRRDRELRLRARQLAAAFGVVALVSGYGFATYNPHWVRDSRVTGTLATLQLFPGQLSQYYTRQSKAFDVVNAIAGIQSQLQKNIDQVASPSTAFNIMFISDMHLASTYPLVRQYAANFKVALIINTGDESEFGTRAEMTPTYLAQLRAVTRHTPMIWLAGNHDSPSTIAAMRSVPGVTVLGTKVARPDGSITVAAQLITAYGLTIGAVPDPRVYGAGGSYGSNDSDVVHTLERRAVDAAVRGVGPAARFDIFATHEPVAADQLAHDLTGQIRETAAGHEHAQNPDAELQHDAMISLVEGSTGAGGLDNINRGVPAPPIEFSIESVAPNCEFTKVVRFQLQGPPPSTSDTMALTGQQVTASTLYLDPQHVAPERSCSISAGRTPIRGVGGRVGG
jgi:calcineurin-like phosphoesterase family protein